MIAVPRPAGGAETAPSTTSREARNEAIRAIPMKHIAPEYRRQIRNVLADTSVYRRLPTVAIDCYPPLFTFMAQNPEVLVQIWRQLGITNVDLVRTGENTFRMSDSVGTVGQLTIVDQQCDDQAQNRIVMIAEGSYDGKPFKTPVRADCVLLLRSGSVVETNGRQYVAARLDTFLRIDRASLELFAKVVHPLVGKMADRNFSDTIHFVGNMSQASAARPGTVERLAKSLPHVSADRKSRLVSITQQCAELQPATADARLARAAE
jgi:hypothetical protein